MAVLLRMPEVAANGTSATIQAWAKAEGDRVAAGDCLAEIETDKAVVELNAEADGVMGRILVPQGREIAVGEPIGILLAGGESKEVIAALLAGAKAPAPAPTEAPVGQASGDQPQQGQAAPRTLASPLARRIAAHYGLNLPGIKGTGPQGRIVKKDVESAAAQATQSVQALQTAAQPPAPVSEFKEVPHTGMRRTIARRLTESKATIPHFYLSADCRTDKLLAIRAEINEGREQKITVNDFIVKAAALALRSVPDANVSWTDSGMRWFNHADIAVAVSTDSGLITPIVRAAESKSLASLSTEIQDLARRARASQLRPDEYQGGCFSISNLGMFGVSEFAAIINPPQAAILAVGASRACPVAEGGRIEVGSLMTCTLSVDHRAIDGAVAARWLQAFKKFIETPASMLV